MVDLITHEIGSLAKIEWLRKINRDIPLTPKDIEWARVWGKRLSLRYEPLIELLQKKTLRQAPRFAEASRGKQGKNFTSKDKQEAQRWASVYGVGMLEKAGIDVVYDGEQQRSEMYQYPVNKSTGFIFRGWVRSFDNRYYRKAACVAEPKIKEPWHTAEYELIETITNRRIKIPITGAYTLAAWSFDEYYCKKAQALGSLANLKSKDRARRDFVLDIARNLIRPNIEELLDRGADWIQIDEPAATTIPSEVGLFVESFNESVKGLKGEFSVHICFSDYRLLFPHIKEMENCSQYALEFSNRDSRELGIKENDRPGYEILKWFKKYKIPSRIGLGVTDIHTDFLESPELVRDRILYSANVLGDARLVDPTPDCGLRTRTWDTAFDKLRVTVEGTRLAERELNGKR